MTNRIFAIGDIHGCHEKLHYLLRRIPADPDSDELIFIGDYIDRAVGGPEVVRCVLELCRSFRRVVCLCGNHESMLLNYLKGIDEDLYLANGGVATLKAYGIKSSDAMHKRIARIPEEHMRFFKTLMPYYETERFIFVHAGLLPGRPLSSQSEYDMQWIRQEFIESRYHFGKRVVFGHTRLSEPLVAENKIGIDTGAVYGGKLTCVELPSIRFYQV